MFVRQLITVYFILKDIKANTCHLEKVLWLCLLCPYALECYWPIQFVSQNKLLYHLYLQSEISMAALAV